MKLRTESASEETCDRTEMSFPIAELITSGSFKSRRVWPVGAVSKTMYS